MTDLIARLEAATEGSRHLDIDLAMAFGWSTVNVGLRVLWRGQNVGITTVVPHFTSSIDAAMTLVAETDWGVGWDAEGRLDDSGRNIGVYQATVWMKDGFGDYISVSGPFCESMSKANSHIPRLICLAELTRREKLKARMT